MEYLHSYWRMDYIEAPKPPHSEAKNPFTEIPKAKNDKDVFIIWRGELTYIVMNTYPYNGGHLLAIPYREVPQLWELTQAEQNALMGTIVLAQEILNRVMKPHGFNIGFNIGSAGGAGIPTHLHAHIVPRWQGDTNFMPVLSKTRILSTCLSTLWGRLKATADTLTLDDIHA